MLKAYRNTYRIVAPVSQYVLYPGPVSRYVSNRELPVSFHSYQEYW